MEERGFRSVRVLLHSLSSRLQILYEEYQRKVSRGIEGKRGDVDKN